MKCGRPRCGRDEDIPTSQFVKVDGGNVYLCERCWQQFRAWLHGGPRVRVILEDHR